MHASLIGRLAIACAAALLVPALPRAAVTTFWSAGAGCAGSSSATFTPGGPPIQVSLCVSTTSGDGVCGATVQPRMVTVGAGGKFNLVGRSLNATILPDSTSAPVFPIALSTTGTPEDFGGTVNVATPPSATASQRLATFELTPLSTATDSGYVVGATTISAVATSSSNCYLAPAETAITATFTLSRAAGQLVATPNTVNFGGHSMGTTSPPGIVTLTNTGSAAVSVTSVNVSTPTFQAAHNCADLQPSASCAINVTMLPPPQLAAPLHARQSLSGLLTIAGTGSTAQTVNLLGTGEKSLMSHYYRAILRRAPDSGGFQFWEQKATEMAQLGVDINEAWFAMAAFFFNSPEYAAFKRDDTGFILDLYNTFFNRLPDSGGAAFWADQIQRGMPREVVLVYFMLSSEFVQFTQNIFGATGVRAEIRSVTDYYRGLMARLPDSDGLSGWVSYFRKAQCAGGNSVSNAMADISRVFATSPEYLGKNRTDAQYVGDLYNAIMRRAGDLGGVLDWIDRLKKGTDTREQVRIAFLSSAESQVRAGEIAQLPCIPQN